MVGLPDVNDVPGTGAGAIGTDVLGGGTPVAVDVENVVVEPGPDVLGAGPGGGTPVAVDGGGTPVGVAVENVVVEPGPDVLGAGPGGGTPVAVVDGLGADARSQTSSKSAQQSPALVHTESQ